MTYNEILSKIIATATANLQQQNDADLSFKASPEKWSKKEILGHLIDSAYNNHRRFLLALDQDNLVFDGYNQVAWVQYSNYQNRDLQDIVTTWATVNTHLSELLKQLPQAKVAAITSDHNFDAISMNTLEKGTPSSLGYMIWDYIFHVEHHLAQILPNYQKMNPDFV